MIYPKKVFHMAVDPGTEITLDELHDNYEFKVVRRAIMREFPWITDVTVTPENLEKFSTIFLDLQVNLPKFLETYGWEPYKAAQNAWDKNLYFYAMHLSLFANITYEVARDVTNEIKELIQSVHHSPALPSDLKIKNGRHFSVGDFYFNKGKADWFYN
jgi:hypothetical protein